METYKLLICFEHETIHHAQYDFQGDLSPDDLSRIVNTLADASRVMMPPQAKLHYCILWRVSGHLSAFSDLRVFHRPFEPELVNPAPLLGARAVGSFSQWCSLKVARDQTLGRGLYRYFDSGISPADMSVIGDGAYINIALASPLLSVSLPLCNALIESVPEVGNVQVTQLGVADSLDDFSRTFAARRGIYHAKRHASEQRRPYSAKIMRAVLIEKAYAARRAALQYQRGMETFSHRWGDNDIPDGIVDALARAIDAARIWYDVAGLLSLSIPDPNPEFAFVNLNDPRWDSEPAPGAPPGRPRWQTAAESFTVETRDFPIVLSCIQSLYACQREAESILAAIQATAQNSITTRLDLPHQKDLWFCRDIGAHYGVRSIYADSDPVGTLPVYGEAFWQCSLYQTSCQQQQAAHKSWSDAGGDIYARSIYDRFERLSHCIMQIKNALHLLPLFLIAHPEVARDLQPGHGRDGYPIARIHSWKAAANDVRSYQIFGQASDLIETHSWDKDPWLNLSIPCLPPMVAGRIPYKQPPPRPYLIDNSILVDNKAQAIQVAIVLIAQGHRDQAQIYYSQRYQQWAVGPSDPDAPIPTAPVP